MIKRQWRVLLLLIDWLDEERASSFRWSSSGYRAGMSETGPEITSTWPLWMNFGGWWAGESGWWWQRGTTYYHLPTSRYLINNPSVVAPTTSTTARIKRPKDTTRGGKSVKKVKRSADAQPSEKATRHANGQAPLSLASSSSSFSLSRRHDNLANKTNARQELNQTRAVVWGNRYHKQG